MGPSGADKTLESLGAAHPVTDATIEWLHSLAHHQQVLDEGQVADSPS